MSAMTEEEWMKCVRPRAMLDLLGRGASRRKLRLFAVACCRRIWGHLDDACRGAVEAAERYADRLCPDRERVEARHRAARSAGSGLAYFAREAAYWASCSTQDVPWGAGAVADSVTAVGKSQHTAEEVAQAALVRELFGSPFRTTALSACCRGPLLQSLAAAGYEERSLPDGALGAAPLAVLADALEEAGCGDETVLGHLRGPGPHVRGCWALDEVLGRR
jgi:hypothetical protein